MAHQRTNLANGLFGAKRGPQQTHRMQILEPLAIQHVGLSTRNVVDMLSIHQMDFDTTGLQNLEQRYPIHPRRFHGDRIDAALLKPVDQLVQILRKSQKRSHRIVVPIPGHGHKNFRCSHVNTTSIRSHLRQTPIQLTMLSSLRLSHGSSPFGEIRQRARRARYENLSSGIIATKKRLRVTNVVAHRPGIKLLNGLTKANTNGVHDLHLPLPCPLFYNWQSTERDQC